MAQKPVIVWFRRDLRLADNAALRDASESGQPVIPVFIHDETVEALGAAARWRIGEGVSALSDSFSALDSRLVLRRGRALEVLQGLIRETGAQSVLWNRVYDPAGIARDREVKAELRSGATEARSCPGAILFEPWGVATRDGKPYSVFSPFWRTIRALDPGTTIAPPVRLQPLSEWPQSERLSEWDMGAAMQCGRDVIARCACVGEKAAQKRLEDFLSDRLDRYAEGRDFPALPATSGLSENLAWGEISPRTVWRAAIAAWEAGRPGAEKFLSELGWREFAWHLLYHNPGMERANWRPAWDAFPWRDDNADAERWRRGMTGEPFVDAAMREMYVTGRMHNRARMVAASYLTKHLLTHWRVGMDWFADCLIDWDPAANALGWQWVAGSGPDAAPYFRVFNPGTQAVKFDPDGAYRARFIAEGQSDPPRSALAYFDAVPRRWGLSPDCDYPDPVIAHVDGRVRALAVYGTTISARAK